MKNFPKHSMLKVLIPRGLLSLRETKCILGRFLWPQFLVKLFENFSWDKKNLLSLYKYIYLFQLVPKRKSYAIINIIFTSLGKKEIHKNLKVN